jgi:chromosomal replication initiation ATPase DnaA
MNQSKEVSSLLTTIKKALKNNVSISRITSNIKQTFTGSDNKDKKVINRIIELCCKEYSVSKHDLIYSKSKGTIPICRKLIVLLLIKNQEMSYRKASAEIQRGVTLSQCAISYWDSLDISKFEEDKDFFDKYNKIRKIINN